MCLYVCVYECVFVCLCELADPLEYYASELRPAGWNFVNLGTDVDPSALRSGRCQWLQQHRNGVDYTPPE